MVFGPKTTPGHMSGRELRRLSGRGQVALPFQIPRFGPFHADIRTPVYSRRRRYIPCQRVDVGALVPHDHGIFRVSRNTRVMCSHCPHYAEPGRTLRCSANYGAAKLWRYRPGQCLSSESFLFLGGLITIFVYPSASMLLGGQWFLLLLYT